MRLRVKTAFAATLLLVGCTFLLADKEFPAGLEAALRSHYKLVSARIAEGTTVVLMPGTILTVRREGILSFLEADASFSELCPSEFQSSGIRIHHKDFCTSGTPHDRRLLRVEETVCVRAIEVGARSDVVKMSVVTCNRGRRDGAPYYALVDFHFSKGSLRSLPAEKVEQVIDQVLAACGDQNSTAKSSSDGISGATNSGCGDSTSSPTEPSPAAHSVPANSSLASAAPDDNPPAAAPPNTIATGIAPGQSVDQVVAVLGRPTSIADLGAKLIYFYPNLKIVFVDGKVSQIQQI